MNTVLNNAKIYTMDAKGTIAKSMFVRGEKIVEINSDNIKYGDKNTQYFNMENKVILPGFIDSHTHPGMTSQSSWHITLPKTNDLDEVLSFVKDYANDHPKEEIPFLYFEYYPTTMFDDKGPNKKILDEIVSDRPCLLQDAGEHLCWVNSKMLELLGVDKHTKDPYPGLQIFVRDKNGEPTGWIKEMAWSHFQNNMFDKIKWWPPELNPDLMHNFFDFMTSVGVTAIVDGITEGENQIKAMSVLDEEERLNTYFDGIVRFDTLKELPEKIEELKYYRKKYSSKHMKFNSMKHFLDGTNESGTCAVLEPFFNDPEGENRGVISMSEEDLSECMSTINNEGLDLHIHIVGDRAFRTACNAYKKAKEHSKIAWTMQLVIAHCELIDPLDMKLPVELGITVNWSCHWSGGYFGEGAIPYLGEERWSRMYQFNPIIKSGALVTFSSDVVTNYELHRANPFFGMQIAQTRVDPEFPLDIEKFPGSQRPPESAKLSLIDLLRGYTINGAKQMRLDNIMGSIEEGKLANFIVLSKDPMKVKPEDFSKIKCETVVFEGKVVKGTL